MIEYLENVIEKALSLGAHDVHLKTAFPPVVRVANTIRRLDIAAPSPKELEKVVMEILDEKRMAQFKAKGQIDCSFEIKDKCRVRANLFFQRNALAISLRLVPQKIPELDKLGFSTELIEMIMKVNRGMILVTGATNSGKSTTVAGVVHLLAQREPLHIITIEDPIEYSFTNYPSSIVSQRQVGEDTPTFQAGLSSALREDPDVILIGELRDQETVETCLKAAETGHLVLGTLHTSNAVQSILRLINIFPSHARDNVRFMLSSCLKIIISQILLPSIDQKGRVLAYEVLPMLASVCNLVRTKKIHEVGAMLRLGRRAGCVPMFSTIEALLKAGKIRAADIPIEYREDKK